MTTPKHFRELPHKLIRTGSYNTADAYIVEGYYDPKMEHLNVLGLTDMTHTEVGKAFLAHPVSVGGDGIGPPIMRVFYEHQETWILVQHEGLWTLVYLPRYVVENPAVMNV